MKKRHGIAAAVAATLVITSTTANADSNLGAFAVGAAVGALINNQVGKNQRQKQSQQRRSSVNSYQRQQNRDVQSALNGFGFPVGAVDGALGQRSRAGSGGNRVGVGEAGVADHGETELGIVFDRVAGGGVG